MASLPAIRLLSEKEPPINRARLIERLKSLAPEDATLLEQLSQVVAWSAVDVTLDDETYVRSVEALLAEIESPTLADALRDRLELRTVVAALRRRHAGEDPPPKGARWGYGRHVERLREGWNLPDFGLSAFYPWISAARDAIEAGDAIALERLTLEIVWRQQEQRGLGHEFDLEAVTLYLVRWSLADRWARYDADVAAHRFQDLVDAALADAPEIEEAA
jgi:hypothetical protein